MNEVNYSEVELTLVDEFNRKEAVFFKIVVIICLFIKLLLFLDLSKPLQRVYSS